MMRDTWNIILREYFEREDSSGKFCLSANLVQHNLVQTGTIPTQGVVWSPERARGGSVTLLGKSLGIGRTRFVERR